MAARHARLPAGRRRLDGPGARRGLRPPSARPATPWSPRSTPRCRASSSSSSPQTIKTARTVTDPVTGRNYVADSGAAVVMEARHRPDRRDGQPADVRPRGLGRRHHQEAELQRLYSEEAGTPLLVPGDAGPVRARLDVEAVHDRGRAHQRLHHRHRAHCSSGFQVGNRVVQELRVRRLRLHRLRQGARGLLQHLLLPGRLRASGSSYGSDVADVDAKDPLVEEAKNFGFGTETGIDLPGEAAGRIADRQWKRDYCKSMKDYYCEIADKPQDAETSDSDFLHLFAHEFCIEGYAYRAGDAVNFAIGQGDTIVTPLQLARAYAALSNGGTLYEPRVGKAIVGPDGDVVQADPAEEGRHASASRRASSTTSTTRCRASPGRARWPGGWSTSRSTRCTIRAKTGSAEVYGKQIDVVGGVLHRGLRRGDDGQPGRHRLGHHRARRSARSGRRSTASTATTVDPTRAAIPGVVAARRGCRPSAATARSCRRPARSGVTR